MSVTCDCPSGDTIRADRMAGRSGPVMWVSKIFARRATPGMYCAFRGRVTMPGDLPDSWRIRFFPRGERSPGETDASPIAERSFGDAASRSLRRLFRSFNRVLPLDNSSKLIRVPANKAGVNEEWLTSGFLLRLFHYCESVTTTTRREAWLRVAEGFEETRSNAFADPRIWKNYLVC